MGKYRKKPVVIEAFQWFGDERQTEDPKWMIDAMDKEDGPQIVVVGKGVCVVMEIKTLEGVMIANSGDWIIRGIQGELYPCKPDVFEATYERIED